MVTWAYRLVLQSVQLVKTPSINPKSLELRPLDGLRFTRSFINV